MMKSKKIILVCLLAVGACWETGMAEDFVGASVPWTTYLNSEGQSSGEILASVKDEDIAAESVARRCVKLTKADDFIEWKVLNPANSIVVRHCIPDKSTGGGTSGAIDLFVNGVLRQKIQLESRHSWLYGEVGKYGKLKNGKSDNPAEGYAHHFFDEAHALIQGAPLRKGDSVRLVLKSTGTAWMIIDLIDLELVAPPAQCPKGFISVTDCGAIPDDDIDDTSAILTAIDRVKVEGKGVWFPAGTFLQSKKIVVPGVVIAGAGPWHTRLKPATLALPQMAEGNCGFKLTGSGAQVRDLMIEGLIQTRDDSIREHAFSLDKARDFRIENTWVSHTKTGMWLSDGVDGILRNNRIRDTYADGINVNNASRRVLIENNHCRNTGDDGLAVWSNLVKGEPGWSDCCHEVTFRNNTVEAPWFAQGIGVYGGEDILVEKNRIVATSRSPGIILMVLGSTGFTTWPGKNISVTNNVIIDCGGTAWNHPWGGIWIRSNEVSLQGLMVRSNKIVRPVYDGIEISGPYPGKISALDGTLESNIISHPGRNGISIESSVKGKLFLKANTITGLANGTQAILNEAPKEQLLISAEP